MKQSKIFETTISSPQRIVFPKQKISKLELAKYYAQVAPKMLPFLVDRPLSVIRCHENINSQVFFKKHPTAEGKDVEIHKIDGQQYYAIKNKNGLINQVQLGTVEFHTWACSFSSTRFPNVMVFDLDPAPDVELEQLRKATLEVKKTLDELNLKSYLKTSGGKGYHVVVPFSKKFSWQKFSNFARQIALLQESKNPQLFTSNIRKDKRGGKVFLDYGRNSKGATCVCPYSVRARDGAPVSVPIFWKDINKFAPNSFSLSSALAYAKANNPWKDFFKNLEQPKSM